MTKIEHIGIAVKDIAKAITTFEEILSSSCYKQEAVESEKVNTAFFKIGESKVELLENTAPGGVIEKFIEKKGEGLHHIAFAVDDIELEMKRLQSLGYTLLNDKPKKGADNKWVSFLHPKDTQGVLIELCMEREEKEG